MGPLILCCHTVVMDRKVKIRTDLFFVRIITLDFMFDVKWEKSSCLISINSESRRNSLLFWADTGSSFQSPFLIKVWNAEVLHWRIKAYESRRLQFSLADMIFRNYTYCICVVRWYICIWKINASTLESTCLKQIKIYFFHLIFKMKKDGLHSFSMLYFDEFSSLKWKLI